MSKQADIRWRYVCLCKYPFQEAESCGSVCSVLVISQSYIQFIKDEHQRKPEKEIMRAIVEEIEVKQ